MNKSILDSTRETLRTHLHEQIHDAIIAFDATEILKRVQDDVLAKATEISQAMLGLETRWSNLELTSSGILTKHLTPIVKDMVEQHLTPMIKTEVLRLLATKSIQDLILRTIKREVKDNIQNLGSYKSAIRTDIEDLVNTEVKRVTESWISEQVDDEWLASIK
jgi:hypothetical protein